MSNLIETISFTVAGERVVGQLHWPEHDEAVPAVIVAGPMTSVKEQVTGVYAAALARLGDCAVGADR